jgi:Fe-S cluster assembly iron-binding protein IscA
MLTLTDNARTAVSGLASQAGVAPDGGLRIVESATTQGSLELSVVAAAEPGDEVVEAAEAHVFVAGATAPALSNLTLDVDSWNSGTSFVLAPQA